MERFKAVEKEMKTKAYSKEGLSAAAKLDPKEKEKVEVCQFLSTMVEELERQIEQFEAESETLQATLKKGRKDTSKAERVAEIEKSVERHKWHQSKLELILRLIENGGLDVEQINDIREDIKFYVEFNQESDFAEDEDIYEGLNLDEEEEAYGVGLDNDRLSSTDTQSQQDEPPEKPIKSSESQSSSTTGTQPTATPNTQRRPSTQLKSPMPAMATMHVTSAITNGATMKPAPAPPRIQGEIRQYASAAREAAANDKNPGIAPLPPPPGLSQTATSTPPASMSPPQIQSLPAPAISKQPKTSPQPPAAIPVEAPAQSSKYSTPAGSVAPSIPPTPLMDTIQAVSHTPATQTPASSYAVPVAVPNMQRDASSQSSQQGQPPIEKPSTTAANQEALQVAAQQEEVYEHDEGYPRDESDNNSFFASTNQPIGESPVVAASEPKRDQNGTTQPTNGTHSSETKYSEPEPIYNLPPGLQDLISSFEAVRARKHNSTSAQSMRLLSASAATLPISQDAERPRHYKPQTPFNTPLHYPQEPLPVFDNPELYRKVDTDTLFYIFYYRQGSYQQYLAASQLKRASWRFHKQYQTWFQRHEEPKVITEEFEQGTYRFFDYESTWYVLISVHTLPLFS